jgi:hypothetical protein
MEPGFSPAHPHRTESSGHHHSSHQHHEHRSHHSQHVPRPHAGHGVDGTMPSPRQHYSAGTPSGPGTENMDKAEVEHRAMKELQTYLGNKGVDSTLAENFEIHAKLTKKKRKSSDGVETLEHKWALTYVDPDGAILSSKGEVYDAVRSLLFRKKRQPAATHSVTRRSASLEASNRLANLELPAVIDGITVISFGYFLDHPSLVSPVQIYPMGYKAQFVYKNTRAGKSGGSNMQTLVVEVSSVDDIPAFSVSNITSGQSHVAFTESSLWKKVSCRIFTVLCSLVLLTDDFFSLILYPMVTMAFHSLTWLLSYSLKD